MDELVEKEIENFIGYYVTENGDIYSIKRGSKIKLKPRVNSRGYLYINLCVDGKYKSFSVHRLVGKAFIDNPNNY